jgi:hypothetical protein
VLVGFRLDVREDEELGRVVRVGLLVEDRGGVGVEDDDGAEVEDGEGAGVDVGSSDSFEDVDIGFEVELGRGGVDVRRIVVDVFFVVVLGGVGGFDGRGGLVVPFVGVSTLLPSQYIVMPFKAISFSTVLIPVVPGPVHSVLLACDGSIGVGYSM